MTAWRDMEDRRIFREIHILNDQPERASKKVLRKPRETGRIFNSKIERKFHPPKNQSIFFHLRLLPTELPTSKHSKRELKKAVNQDDRTFQIKLINVNDSKNR